MSKRIVIIGAGIGGLATGPLLAKEGHDVTILEKNTGIGGRAGVFTDQGFTFDMGPSWYLMPDVFDAYFALFGTKPTDYFSLKRLDPQYRVFYGPGDYLDVSSHIEKNIERFEQIEPGVGSKMYAYLDTCREGYELTMKHFLYTSFQNPLEAARPGVILELLQKRLYESLETYVSRYVSDEKIKKILLYHTVFLGGSPQNIPAMYSIMSHVDLQQGVYYPYGGIYKVIQGLEALNKKYKVAIHTNEEVTHIHVNTQKTAYEVSTTNATFPADIVIMNGDYHYAETKLLDSAYVTYPEGYWSKRTMAPSAMLLYLGVKGSVSNLQHHSIFFSQNWRNHMDEMFVNPTWPTDPSYYVCAPSKTDFSVAPDGHENMFILIPVASGLEDTPEFRETYSAKIIAHLEATIGTPIADRIVYKKIWAHKDFFSLFHAYRGTALGLSHTLMQSALLRPTNRSKKVSNLYYVGQYTLPGIGMPMCIISAQLAAERIRHEQ